jgi:hypothetical protein
VTDAFVVIAWKCDERDVTWLRHGGVVKCVACPRDGQLDTVLKGVVIAIVHVLMCDSETAGK